MTHPEPHASGTRFQATNHPMPAPDEAQSFTTCEAATPTERALAEIRSDARVFRVIKAVLSMQALAREEQVIVLDELLQHRRSPALANLLTLLRADMSAASPAQQFLTPLEIVARHDCLHDLAGCLRKTGQPPSDELCYRAFEVGLTLNTYKGIVEAAELAA
ncbi:hypothetical protein Q5Y75_04175 [Ruegeria sp. 2205SS24-7]|uniref:hypothetical protein n=1 Tax=Ruegeria discodermiae TaxID=3064389 RepID=UPI002740EAD4|nr:hypothetical protein [Ruegeria sp. 2205SS24-7]MDP5216406.1 hypothetical protein [Ruegeria sp. 2205SS24-7]